MAEIRSNAFAFSQKQLKKRTRSSRLRSQEEPRPLRRCAGQPVERILGGVCPKVHLKNNLNGKFYVTWVYHSLKNSIQKPIELHTLKG